MAKFVRCQECGGESERGEFNTWRGKDEDMVRCKSCGESDTPDDWNNTNLQTRARRRFDLVVAMAGAQSLVDAGFSVFYPVQEVIARADAILNEMYGKVEGGQDHE